MGVPVAALVADQRETTAIPMSDRDQRRAIEAKALLENTLWIEAWQAWSTSPKRKTALKT